MRILLVSTIVFILLMQTANAQSFQIGAEAGIGKSFVKPGPDYIKEYDQMYFKQRGTINPRFFINTRLNINPKWAVIAGAGIRGMGYKFKQDNFGTDIVEGYTSFSPGIANSELHLKGEYLFPLPANTALGVNIGIKAGRSRAVQYTGSFSMQPTASFEEGDHFKDSILYQADDLWATKSFISPYIGVEWLMYWNEQPKLTIGLEFVPGLQSVSPVYYTGRFSENNITYIFEKTLNPTIHTLNVRAGYYFTLIKKKDKV